MPLIGPSVDRRSLTLVCRLANSDTVCALSCFACAQLHTWVSSWEKQQPTQGSNPLLHEQRADIAYHTVADTLLRLEQSNLAAFMLNFSLHKFKERFASGHEGNPLHGAEELQEGAHEWQRRLLLPQKGQAVQLLCCPEDVKRDSSCTHGEGDICGRCQIPLCCTCFRRIRKRSGSNTIPMVLCNDNFWGYALAAIWKYNVRWVEAAIASPCWTSMMVYYVEGDGGHLMNERLGEQLFRTAVRGSASTFHMPWEEILKNLQSNCLDKELAQLPRPEERLKYLLRVHVKLGGVDLKKHLKGAHVRPCDFAPGVSH